MAVIKNQPLPDGHPLKDGLIVFGQRRPDSSASQSAQGAPSAKPPQEELAASRYYEQEISRLPNDTDNQLKDQLQSLESIIPEILDQLSPGTSTEQD